MPAAPGFRGRASTRLQRGLFMIVGGLAVSVGAPTGVAACAPDGRGECRKPLSPIEKPRRRRARSGLGHHGDVRRWRRTHLGANSDTTRGRKSAVLTPSRSRTLWHTGYHWPRRAGTGECGVPLVLAHRDPPAPDHNLRPAIRTNRGIALAGAVARVAG